MSWIALAWASSKKLERASDKLILLAFADRHNDETGFAYPSIQWLCEFSSLNRKTVIASIDRLEAAGCLEDSGRRVGATKQVKVYTVLVGEIQRVPKPEPLKSAVFSGKESQKRDTEPSREPTSTNVDAKHAKRKSFPLDWSVSSDDAAYAASKGMTPMEIRDAAEDFRDHFIAHGEARKSTNWSLNWKRWVRTSLEYRRPRMAGGKNSAAGGRSDTSFADIAARRRREREQGMEIPGGQTGLCGDDLGWSEGAIDGNATVGYSEAGNGHDPSFPF